MQQASAPKVSFVSLGCPKALVDSERIITRLRAEGYELARKHDGADLVIVNTCGFLDSAKRESLSAIGEAMAENGKVIVTGCMGAEPEQIEAAYPGVLSITGPQQYESVLEAVHRAVLARFRRPGHGHHVVLHGDLQLGVRQLDRQLPLGPFEADGVGRDLRLDLVFELDGQLSDAAHGREVL
jgi:hypothetical protein